jgi:hypothetical protein
LILLALTPPGCAKNASSSPGGGGRDTTTEENEPGNRGADDDLLDDIDIAIPEEDAGPPPTGGDVMEAPLLDCTENADCCPQDDECVSEEEYICTVDDKCGKVEGPCTEQSECQGDTYCCIGDECRKDGNSAGVCIPASVPPFLPCGEAVTISSSP